MSEKAGVVTSLDGADALVEIGPRESGCGRCHEVGGCASSLLGGAATREKRSYRLPNRIGAQVGDSVLLTIPEGSLFKVSLFAYLLPAVLVIIGAAFGTAVSDGAAVAGALLGLLLGLAILRLAQGRLLSAREPLLSMRIKPCAFHLHKEPRL